MRTLSINELNQVAAGLKASEIVEKAFYIGAGIGVMSGVLRANSAPELVIEAFGCGLVDALLCTLASLPFAAIASITE